MNPLFHPTPRLRAPAGDDGADTGGAGSTGSAGAAEGSIEELAHLVGASDGDAGDDGYGQDDGGDAEGALSQSREDDRDRGDHGDTDQDGDANAGADDPDEEWEAGGHRFKVKKSELRAGYMKDADYRAKTAKVADQQRHLDAFATHLQQERQTAANQLGVMIQALQQELVGSQPNASLIDTDPQEYMRQQVLHGERVHKLQQAMGHRQALQQQFAATQAQRAQIRHREESELLATAVPEWRNPSVRARELKDLGHSLVARGFTVDEVSNTADHRIVLLARDAARYRQLVEARAKTAKPPLPRPVRPGASGQGTSNSGTQRAKERLSRNPNDIDALAGYLGASGL